VAADVNAEQCEGECGEGAHSEFRAVTGSGLALGRRRLFDATGAVARDAQYACSPDPHERRLCFVGVVEQTNSRSVAVTPASFLAAANAMLAA
jgi:hypothetical protein